MTAALEIESPTTDTNTMKSTKAAATTGQQERSRRVVLGVALWLVVCIIYLKGGAASGDVVDGTTGTAKSKSSSSSKLSFTAPSIQLQPLMEFMNKTAGIVYDDHYPDCLYILKQVVEPTTNRTKYILEQSMNDYWKHVIGFRKVQLKFNVGMLIDMVETLNMDAPLTHHLEENLLKASTPQRYHHQLLHQRIYDAGGTLPFYTHWRLLHPEDTSICNDVHKFPIFRRALPSPECSNDDNFNYWLIPTAPIIRQIKKVSWDYKMKHMVSRSRQQRKIAVATTASEIKDPSTDYYTLKRKSEENRDDGANTLVGKLHFVEKSKIVDKGDDWKPEKFEMYDLYTGVIDIDSTSNLYPSLLCQTSVVLMRHPTNFVDIFTSTLQPMVHYVPIKPDLSDIEQQVNYVLDEKNSEKMNTIVNNAQSWCRQHMTMSYLKERTMTSLTTFVEGLDNADPTWTKTWKDNHEKYLVGHWLKQPGGDSWSLPVSIVGGIKNGLRRDSPMATKLMNEAGRR